MLYTNYTPEIIAAQNFIKEHKEDIAFHELMARARNRTLRHSDRWSMIYDYMEKYYPNTSGFIITGLAYVAES